MKGPRSARMEQIIEHVTQNCHHITQERLTSAIGRPVVYSVVEKEGYTNGIVCIYVYVCQMLSFRVELVIRRIKLCA